MKFISGYPLVLALFQGRQSNFTLPQTCKGRWDGGDRGMGKHHRRSDCPTTPAPIRNIIIIIIIINRRRGQLIITNLLKITRYHNLIPK